MPMDPRQAAYAAALSGGPQPQPLPREALAQALSAPPDPFAEASKQYPIIKGFDGGYVNTPMPGDDRKLEFWPADEPGDEQYPRPKEFPMGKPGIQQISPDTTSTDIAADIVSHQLVKTDPKLKAMYDQFSQTFKTPEGVAKLQQDYAWAKQNEGETRPFDQWAETTRIPDYFRGYVFKQWPEKARGGMSSQDQRGMLDTMSNYISGKP